MLLSCQVKRQDYIAYLNKINEIDSIYRMANDTVNALNRYEKLFVKRPAYQDDLIREFETYKTLRSVQKRFRRKGKFIYVNSFTGSQLEV